MSRRINAHLVTEIDDEPFEIVLNDALDEIQAQSGNIVKDITYTTQVVDQDGEAFLWHSAVIVYEYDQPEPHS